MARISDSNGRKDGNSGYVRLFGNEELGGLVSRIHSTAIRSGYELESLLKELVPREHVLPVEMVRERIQAGEGMMLPPSTVTFNSRGRVRSLGYEGHADIVICNHLDQCALVVELKDGDSFDTKKSAGELKSLMEHSGWLATVTNYQVAYALCCFNARSRQAILRGLKGKFREDEVMTGSELCALLGFPYEHALGLRRVDQQGNLAAFAAAVLTIPELRSLILQCVEQESWLHEDQLLLLEHVE